jgi:hypothetical protein
MVVLDVTAVASGRKADVKNRIKLEVDERDERDTC